MNSFVASMSMEIIKPKKISEFYEELKRLEISVKRPDINYSYSKFFFRQKKFILCIRRH